ncbi:hypothetical protein [Mycoplasmopsis cynos]|uniref:hypothetical protein n=2 Tax=Mycoplasmopsis cynos TaxID=171284 RepID=UPI0022045D96|nr:hypothetical protein [Mycoplasmopsis cynos]UWV92289.1 hypothetical protein NWE57_05420 [Mycoplasmopsis cynos]
MKYISNIMAKKYFAKEPSGKYLSFSEMWALERGLDISIPAVTKLAFLYKKSGSFFKTMQEYMIKFNRLLTSKNVDSINIEKALLKILSSLKKLYISINEDIKIDT